MSTSRVPATVVPNVRRPSGWIALRNDSPQELFFRNGAPRAGVLVYSERVTIFPTRRRAYLAIQRTRALRHANAKGPEDHWRTIIVYPPNHGADGRGEGVVS